MHISGKVFGKEFKTITFALNRSSFITRKIREYAKKQAENFRPENKIR